MNLHETTRGCKQFHALRNDYPPSKPLGSNIRLYMSNSMDIPATGYYKHFKLEYQPFYEKLHGLCIRGFYQKMVYRKAVLDYFKS